MNKTIAIIVLIFTLNGCSDSEADKVAVSTDEDGNTVYEADFSNEKPVGIIPNSEELNTLKEVSELEDFRVGQVWIYKTRNEEESSRVTILRLEQNHNIGGIVHVSLMGLKIKNSAAADGLAKEASHLPFSLEAIKNSVIELESTVEVDMEYMQGYGIWRSAFEQGKAGVFTTSLIDGIEFLEDTFRRANIQQSSPTDAKSQNP